MCSIHIEDGGVPVEMVKLYKINVDEANRLMSRPRIKAVIGNNPHAENIRGMFSFMGGYFDRFTVF